MKRTILALLMILSLLLASCALGDDGADIAVPVSMSEFLGRYPDSEASDDDDGRTELYSGVTPELLDGFVEFLRGKTARFLKDQKEAATEEEASVMTGSIKVDRLKVTLPFEYNYGTGEMKITYPAGTYDERVRTAQEQYEKMADLASAGRYDEAAQAYLLIPAPDQFAPVAELVAGSDDLAHAIRRSYLKIVGGHVTFGSYEQDDNLDNGPEEIEWIVLDTKDGKSLLISRYVLDAGVYHSDYVPVTWETSSLRAWLNSDFLGAAFSSEEQKAILSVTVENGPDQGYVEYETDGGNSTDDSVFLLSYGETWQYFSSEEERLCVPTAYAAGRGVWRNVGVSTDGQNPCSWWLRSPGSLEGCACRVRTDGDLGSSFADDRDPGIRPVIWVDLSADIF